MTLVSEPISTVRLPKPSKPRPFSKVSATSAKKRRPSSQSPRASNRLQGRFGGSRRSRKLYAFKSSRSKYSQGWSTVDERDILASAFRDDPVLFLKYCIGLDNPSNPLSGWWDDAVHTPLVRWMEAQIRAWQADRRAGKRRRRYCAIVVPRLVGKTTLITKGMMLWLHLLDPNLATVLGNETREMAASFLTAIKAWIHGDDRYSLFPWCFGNWGYGAKDWTRYSVTHNARTAARSEASFGIFSIGSGITGRHVDVLCADDLVSYEGLEKDVDLFDSAWSTLSAITPVVENNGLVILIGTRYGEGDPHGRAISQDKVASVSGMPDEDEYRPTKGGLWHMYFLSGRNSDGTPAIPTVWPESEMAVWERRDPVKYVFQVLCRPRKSTLHILSDTEFDRSIISRETPLPRDLLVAIHLDTAFKHTDRKSANHDNVIFLSGHRPIHPDIVYALGCWADPLWKAEDMGMHILAAHRWAQEHGWTPILITDEGEVGGKWGVWEAYLSTIYSDAKMEMPPFAAGQRNSIGKSKDLRITEGLSFIVRQKVRIWRDMPGYDAFRHQALHFPNLHKRDILDAFADSFHPVVFSSLSAWRPRDEAYEFSPWERELKPYDILGTHDNLREDRPPIR